MVVLSSVDAALAELDSIPDEVCESGDVEEEDEEEEEWSYYRMDLQTQPQVGVDSIFIHHLAPRRHIRIFSPIFF